MPWRVGPWRAHDWEGRCDLEGHCDLEGRCDRKDAVTRHDRGLALTWLGHATVDVRLGGTRVVTDPVLRDRLGHLVRHDGTATLESGSVDGHDAGAPPLDAVLISHLHHDHLDLPSLRRLPPGTTVVVPRGAGRLVARHAPGEVVEVRIEDHVDIGKVRITAVPAEHHPGRFLSRARATAIGYLIEGPEFEEPQRIETSEPNGGHRPIRRVYFPGDTDLHPAMAELPAPDIALLPIWGWGRTLGSAHLDPDRAAQAAAILRARAVLPIHWGTFAPRAVSTRRPRWLDQPAETFTAAMARHAPDSELRLVRPGPQPVMFPETHPRFLPTSPGPHHE